jgi:aminoglycoside phosphotransferase (APT) family kinase protein
VENLSGTLSSGFSTETVFFDLLGTIDGAVEQRKLVARVANGAGIFPDYDLGQEYRVMQAVAEHTQVPVLELLLYEDNPAYLGAPFIVMARVEGRSAADDRPSPSRAGWSSLLPSSNARSTTTH